MAYCLGNEFSYSVPPVVGQGLSVLQIKDVGQLYREKTPNSFLSLSFACSSLVVLNLIWIVFRQLMPSPFSADSFGDGYLFDRPLISSLFQSHCLKVTECVYSNIFGTSGPRYILLILLCFAPFADFGFECCLCSFSFFSREILKSINMNSSHLRHRLYKNDSYLVDHLAFI